MTEQQNKKTPKLPFGPKNQQGKRPPGMPPQKNPSFKYIIITILVISGIMALNQYQNVEKIEWSEFVNHIDSNDIKHFTVKENTISGQFTEEYINSNEGTKETFDVSYNPNVGVMLL